MLIAAGLLSVVAALLAARPASAETLAPAQPQEFIRSLSADAGRTIIDGGADTIERERLLRALMDRHVAIGFLARFGLGDRWQGLSESERSEYQALFRAFFLRKYAAMLGGYEGQNLTVLGARAVGGTDVLVESRVSSPDGGQPLPAAWRVRLFDGRPMIIDIVVEGISVAVNQREEFASVIASKGFSGLLNILREQTAA